MVSYDRPRGLCLLLLLLLATWAQPGWAEEPEEPYRYLGAFWGLQAHSGVLIPEGLSEGSEPGVYYGVSARFALFATLVDLELKATAGHYTLAQPGGDPAKIDRFSIGIENHAHPFLVLIIQKRPLQQWLAGLYLSMGLDLDIAHRQDDGELFIYPGFKMGLGSEYPLTDPDAGWSLWLGLSYHYKMTIGEAPELGDMNEHLVALTLGYRNNNIYFARAPRLPEFDYKNSPIDDR